MNGTKFRRLSQLLQYRPLRFFWIAEFSDGSAVAQFNPDTGQEVKSHPDWLPSKIDADGNVTVDGVKIPYRKAYPIPEHFKDKTVVRLGWYPFNFFLAQKIYRATKKLVVPSNAKPLIIDVKEGETPLCSRTPRVKVHIGRKVKQAVEYAPTTYNLGIKGKQLQKMSESGEVS